MEYREHWDAANDFLRVMDEGLAVGRPLLACEVMWGAATHAIRAYARWRGWRVGKSPRLAELVERMVREQNDIFLRDGFSKAALLHANFYNGFMDADSITENQAIVRIFAERVLALVPADSPTAGN